MMNLNSIANHAPVSPRFTRLHAGETHFYSFVVAETQKQRMGYQPLPNLQYLCHFTDQRLIFELQSPLYYAAPSALQQASRAVAQQALLTVEHQGMPSDGARDIATFTDMAEQVFQLGYKTIAAFKGVRTLRGFYAKIVLHSGATAEEQAIVLAVRETGDRKRNCAGNFVQLGRDFLNPGGFSQMFEFDPQAVSWFNQEVKASPIPVLVDFWAPGCEPCRVMKPVIDEIKVQFDDRLKIIRVNVDENFSVPMHYNVNCFPTLLLFKSGIVAEQISGTVSAKTLSKALNRYLAE